MKVTRRGFLKGTATTGSAVALASFIDGPLNTLQAMTPEELAASSSEKFVPTTCWIGKQDCGILARVVDDRIVKLEGNPIHPRNKGSLCPKGLAQLMSVYDPNRVKAPLIRTNEKGVPGTWRQASWDEALTIVGDKIKDIRERDIKKLVWQKGRSKAKPMYDKAFVGASGATKLHHGAFCSDAGYRALEYTIGMHGVLHPDFKHTKYLLAWGWNATAGGGNKFCWITWPQQLMKAKAENGLKMVAIDPRQRGTMHYADDWLPIRPGTDLALALAICHGLIENDTIDHTYLKTYTNSGFLVKEDGHFLEKNGKKLVWDSKTNKAVAYESANSDPALLGEYEIKGQKVTPVFQLYKNHVAENTPEWAEEKTGVPAAQIKEIIVDLAKNAMIGSTIVVDGITLPYRPVAIMAYHMSQQELGFQALRAMTMISMLVGSIGAVGGQFTDFTWKKHKNWDKLDKIKIKEKTNIYLKNSKFYPINSNNSSLMAHAIQDPDKYGIDKLPEVVIVHMCNPMGSFPDRKANMKAYQQFKFVCVIDPWLSLTADLYADVVLPAATMEKYEGPMKATDQYTDAIAMRVPPVAPIFDSKGDIDIYIALCEKAGILYGKGGYLDHANKNMKLKDPYLLPLDKTTDARDVMDRWAKSAGISEGIEYFEKNGVKIKGKVPAKKYYGYATTPKFAGAYPHRLYGESLLGYQEEMKKLGAGKVYWQDYTALPTWRDQTVDKSPGQYDLYLTSFHKIEFKQSRTPIPMMTELAPFAVLEINPKTAKERNIADGDKVSVESHNAVTGETRLIEVLVSFREGIRPDTVAMPHHYGEHTNHPSLKGQGPSPNELFFTGEGYVSNTADQTYLVKVRVFKA